MRTYRPKQLTNKSTFLIIGTAFITIILIIKLFQLQVLAHDYYQEIATKEQYGLMELPAQRGEIVIQDYHSNEEFLIATNTTLNLLYADPFMTQDPVYVGEALHPLIFNLEEERQKDEVRIQELSENIPPELSEEEVNKLLTPLTDDELKIQSKQNLIDAISQKQRPEILLATSLTPATITTVQSMNLNGITAKDDVVYAYPPQISNPAGLAEKLSPVLEIPSSQLANILKGENRYVILAKKLEPDISEQINELMETDTEGKFLGVGMKEEYYRYYPEGSLAANIVGYVSKDNVGQYGIESTFNTQLKGVAGRIEAKKDSLNRQITVGESILEPAVDGDAIVLTIDRSVQLKVEKILENAVNRYRADSGQVLIMNPQTGAIVAMAHYPTFDPNNYGDVFETEEFEIAPEDMEKMVPHPKEEATYWFYENLITKNRFKVFEAKDEHGNTKYYKYKNKVGPEVYHNKIVSWPYEPGSVFKSIAMAIAIDDGDVTPNTKYNDSGPIGVDFNVYSQDYDFEIKNSDGYFGVVDMTTVLAKSLNTGMTFVAKEIGPALFYSYMDKFGFLDRTDIEFDTEAEGRIEYFDDWSESELATHAFGQGILINMVQMANSYCTLVNGGVLMRPHIVSEVRHDDNTVTETEPHEIRRVISEESSHKMIAMLTHSVENGVANLAQIDGHYVGGKTGTSQTYRHGKAVSGKGTTIASFAGFGPVNNPEFVILIKLDHPKENEWGSKTAAPTFAEIASYLFDYYNIPPDKY